MDGLQVRVADILASFPADADAADLTAVGVAAARLVNACEQLETAAYAALGGLEGERAQGRAVLGSLLPVFVLALCLDGDAENARFAYLRAQACVKDLAGIPDLTPAVTVAQTLLQRRYPATFEALLGASWDPETAKVASALAAKTRRTVWNTFRRSHTRVSSQALAQKLGLSENEALEQAATFGWRKVPVAADVMETETSSTVLERQEQPEDSSSMVGAADAARRAAARIESLIGKVLTLEQPASFDTRGVVEATIAANQPSSNNRQGA